MLRLSEYQKLALRTAPAFLPRHLTREQDHLLHATLGISGEVSELIKDQEDQANVVQEAGDIMWYCALFCQAIKINLEDIEVGIPLGDCSYDDLVFHAGVISDKVKRHIYYGTDLDVEECLLAIAGIMSCLHVLTYKDLPDALEKNILKLKLRYPDNFTSESAVNRNVKKEEKIFEES